MRENATVDPAALGLDPQYNPQQRERIRRLILEDCKKAGVKLPTYMKLVARYIAPAGVPEEWLAKLSHQTMDKMLKRTSTPRYEFWACLHLYLRRKYGEVGISATAEDEIDAFGHALARFAGNHEPVTGRYVLTSGDEAALDIAAGKADAYARIRAVRRTESDEPFAEPVTIPASGAGVIKEARLTTVLRDIATRELSTLNVEIAALAELTDPGLADRLDRLCEAP